MAKFYSAQTNGFYDPIIHETMPLDALEISDDLYFQMLDGQSSGKIISPGPDGYPVLIDPPPAPYVLINLPVDVFFERTTEEEAEEIETAMLAKPVKIKRAYQAATTFKEGTDLWEALWTEIESLLGAARRDELMARPTYDEMSRAPAE